MPLLIKTGLLDHPHVIALLEAHVTSARAATAAGSAHALDLSGLRAPEIDFWTAWEDQTLMGMAALKRLSPVHGEIKSMHTAKSSRRRGVGSALLRHLIETARVRGMNRLSLETGSSAYFVPARAFYARHGFVECDPFGDYKLDPNSRFMTLGLEPLRG